MPTNVFAGSRSVKLGAGSLFYAPLGSAEPISCTGAWPSAWTPLGYTEQGSTFTYSLTTASVTPEEEYDAVLNYITGRTTTMAFNLLESTAQNLAVALNLAGTPSGVLDDGTIYLEPPDPGTETRIMIGWGADLEASAPTGVDPAYGRIIIRQALQTGNLQVTRRKAPNAASASCTFTGEKPATGAKLFRWLTPADLAA